MDLPTVYELSGAAHAFALRYRRPVVAIWPISSELACPYEQLFTLDSPVLLVNLDQTRRTRQLLVRVLRWLVSGFGSGLNRPIVPGIPWGDPPRYAPRWMLFQWIKICAEFEDYSHLAAPFRPISELCELARKRVDAARGDGFTAVRIHIRRMDHRYSIAHSKTKAFIDAIEWRLRLISSSRFLLCTDDPSEAKTLQAQFGDHVLWFPPASLDRAHREAAVAAMTDFLALSSFDSIVGSYLSSLSILGRLWKTSAIRGTMAL